MLCSCSHPTEFVHVKVLRGVDVCTKVFVRFVGTNCCTLSVDRYLSEMATVYADKKPFQVLYDATEVGRLPLYTIQKVAAFMRRFDDLTRLYLQKCAITISSEWARAALTTLFIIKVPACPLKTFTTVGEAKTWLRAKD